MQISRAIDSSAKACENLPIELQHRIVTHFYVKHPLRINPTRKYDEKRNIFKVNTHWWADGFYDDIAIIGFLINLLQPIEIQLLKNSDQIGRKRHSSLPSILYVFPNHLRKRLKVVAYPEIIEEEEED